MTNTSATALGLAGAPTTQPQASAAATLSVNVATGNLLMQRRDEFLAAPGTGLELTRTYNSLGAFDGDRAGQWKFGLVRNVSNLTGTLDTAGSTVSRIDGDGQVTVFVYDAEAGLYRASGTAGSDQTLSLGPDQQWSWSDNRGAAAVTEYYDSLHNGRIVRTAVAGQDTLAYAYNEAGLVAQIVDAGGDRTAFDYDAAGNLVALHTRTAGAEHDSAHLRYTYDGLNRLQRVEVDLTPADASLADGNSYATTYTYDGTSGRVASMVQDDGHQLFYTYVENAGCWKIASVADETGATTRLDYATAGQTKVTDPAGRAYTYTYDAAGRVVRVTGPFQAGYLPGGKYTYDDAGNLIRAEDWSGKVATYAYDAHGNCVRMLDTTGLLTERTYSDDGKRLLVETTSQQPPLTTTGTAPVAMTALADGPALADASAAPPRSTRFIYDPAGRLRFTLGPSGEVQEYRYGGAGLRTVEMAYAPSAPLDPGWDGQVALTEQGLTAWLASGRYDLTQARRVERDYDARGLVACVTTYSAVSATGAGVGPARVHYVFDQAGRLLQSTGADGVTTSYSYDALGRVQTQGGAGGTVLSVYDDVPTRSMTTLSSGWSGSSLISSSGIPPVADGSVHLKEPALAADPQVSLGIVGTSGADTLHGTDADNLITGLAGDDLLSGGKGNDTYVFGRGDGQDRIEVDDDRTPGRVDTLRWSTGVVPADIVLSRSGFDLVASIAGTSDAVTIGGFYYGENPSANPYNPVQQFAFADDTVWDLAALVARAPAALAQGRVTGGAGVDNLTGSAGNDQVYGLGGNDNLSGAAGQDTLTGGTGNDTLAGGAGNDTYVLATGDGIDVIGESDTTVGNVDTLAFIDVPSTALANREAIAVTQLFRALVGNAPSAADRDRWSDVLLRGVPPSTVADQLLGRADIAVLYPATQTPQDFIDALFQSALNRLPTQAERDGNVALLASGKTRGQIVDQFIGGIAASGADRDAWNSAMGDLARPVTVERTATNLVIRYGVGDQVTVAGFYAVSGAASVEQITFSDGVTLSLTDLGKNAATYGTVGNDSLNGDALSYRYDALGGDDVVSAGAVASVLQGGAGNDRLIGSSGADTLVGGLGNDSLSGGVGDDTYVFAQGDGADTITDQDSVAGNSDVIRFVDVASTALSSNEAVAVTRLYQALLGHAPDSAALDAAVAFLMRGYSYANLADRILASPAGLTAYPSSQSTAEFIAGLYRTALDRDPTTSETDALSSVLALPGATRGSLVDQFIGGIAPSGSDRTTWDAKMGPLARPVTLERVGTSLLIHYGAGDQISIASYYSGTSASQVERLTFSDGVTVSLTDLGAHAVMYGTAGADNPYADKSSNRYFLLSGNDGITGSAGAEEIQGGAGNDNLNGAAGADTLVGGLGNDSLNGGVDNDTYVFAKGDGIDVITDNDTTVGNVDTISFVDVPFAALASREQVTVTQAFEALLGRVPAPAEVDANTATLLRGYGLAEIANRLLNTPEAMQRYDRTDSDAAFIGKLYQSALERQPTADELAAGEALLRAGGTRGNLVEGLIANVASTGPDRSTWDAKMGALASPICIEASGSNVVIRYGNGDQITISNQLGAASYRIEQVRFCDGQQLDLVAYLAEAIQYGTEGADPQTSMSPTIHRRYTLGGDDSFSGGALDDVLQGGAGNDKIWSGAGHDTLVGGLGNDTLVGVGNYTDYVFSAGDGNDSIDLTHADGGIARVAFTDVPSTAFSTREAVATNEVFQALLGRSPNVDELSACTAFLLRGFSAADLANKILGGTEGKLAYPVLASADEFVSALYEHALQRTPSEAEALAALTRLAQPGASRGALVTNLIAAIPGDGADRDTWNAKLGALAQPLTLERVSNELIIKYGAGDAITVQRYFYAVYPQSLQISFSDGVTLDVGSLTPHVAEYATGVNGNFVLDARTHLAYGRDGADFLKGAALDDVVQGGAGADLLYGGAGSDTLVGGLGHDVLSGDDGNDTYVFTSGDGVDSVYENAYTTGNNDTIVLTDIASTMIASREKVSITKLYAALLDRAPDPAGEQWWIHTMYRGASFAECAQGIATSDEASFIYPPGLSTEQFITTLFMHTVNRAPTDAEVQTYLAVGNASANPRGAIVEALLGSISTGIDFENWQEKMGPLAKAVTFEMSGNTFAIHYGNGDRIDMAMASGSVDFGIEQIKFSDKTMSMADLAANLPTYGTEGDDWLRVSAPSHRLFGLGGNDHLTGDGSDDTLDGGAGNDALTGNAGADVLTGGQGNDMLDGGVGNDTYLYYRGDGDDTISDNDATAGNIDTLRFMDMAESEVVGRDRVGYDYVLTLSTGNRITISNYYLNDQYKIEKFEFLGAGTATDPSKAVSYTGTAGSDNLTGSSTGDNRMLGLDGNDTLTGGTGNDYLDGGTGNDSLIGLAGDDTLIGGSGNDILDGGAGNDSYLFARGFGQDLVRNADTGVGRNDTILFGAGIAVADLRVARSVNDLVIKVTDPANAQALDQVTVANWFSGTTNRVNQLVFVDGTVLSADQVELLTNTIRGTAGVDSLNGSAQAGSIFGLDGDDTIVDLDGSDVIDGGAGNDTITDQGTGTNVLDGGDGDDTINFSGHANNTVNGGGGNDMLRMTDYGTVDSSATANVLAGGAGDDRYISGSSKDSYLFNRGDGHDSILDFDALGSGSVDKLAFGPGIRQSDLEVTRDGDNLIIKIGGAAGASDQVTLEKWFVSGAYRIEHVTFADGSGISAAQLEQLSQSVIAAGGPNEASLGLYNASAASAASITTIGQADEREYINAATGNLVLQHVDDTHALIGLDANLVRTYNSQAAAGADWQFSFERQVQLGADGKLVRLNGDGSQSIYTAFGAMYVSTDGQGAYDSLSLDAKGSTWTWTDGTTGARETYDAVSGRITSAIDLSGNVTDYVYDASRLTRITSRASGESMVFDYADGKLAAVHDEYMQDRITLSKTRVHYGYSNGRLETVTVDLTPDDNSITDGKTYVTTYGYDPVSGLVNKVSQSDGTSVAFAYLPGQGEHAWLSTATDALDHVTKLTRDANGGTVTDPAGHKTAYVYDASGQLSTVTDVDTKQQTKYGYDALGNLASVTDPRQIVTTFDYDQHGHQVTQKIDKLQAIARTFGTQPGQLLTETVFTGAGGTGAPATARNVYDALGRLRFQLSAEGRVTERHYNSDGTVAAQVVYTGAAYDVSLLDSTTAPSEAALVAWAKAADKTRTVLTTYTYDGRGLMRTATTYGKVDAAGNGVVDVNTSVQTYMYDVAGQLRQTIDARGRQISYSYDGLGRLKATLDSAGVLNSTTVYDDAGLKVTTTVGATGVVTTSLYDAAGNAVSTSQKSAADVITTTYAYDAAGRLRMTTGPTGQRSYVLYDAAGRKSADIDADGSLVEYFYNDDNQVTRTTAYANTVDVTKLVDSKGQPAVIGVDALRVRDAAHDRNTWSTYDGAGRLYETVDAKGTLTRNIYDGAGRVVESKEMATVDISLLANIDTPTTFTFTGTVEERATRYFYDQDGNRTAVLDAEGLLSENIYNAGGQLAGTLRYQSVVAADSRAASTLAQLRQLAAPALAGERYLYDSKSQLVGTVDAAGYLTEMVYDKDGNLSSKTQYDSVVTFSADATMATLRPAVKASDRTWTYTYSALNQVDQATGPDGAVTTHVYDSAGRLRGTTQSQGKTALSSSEMLYDGFGRVIGTLEPDALPPGKLVSESDPLWQSRAARSTYDAAGRMTTSTDQNGNRTLYFYNSDGRLAYTLNALGEVSAMYYNAFNELEKTVNLAQRVDGLALAALIQSGTTATMAQAVSDMLGSGDAVETFEYDVRGQLVEHDGPSTKLTTEYDAFGEAVEQKLAGQVRSRTFYDSDGRVFATLDGAGALTSRRYDANGNVVERIAYATAIDAASTATQVRDLIASGLKADPAHDTHQRMVYDARGVLKASFTARMDGTRLGWSVTTQDVDGNGNVTGTVAYARLLEASDPAASGTFLPGEDDLARLVSDPADAMVRYRYDGAGRVVASATAQALGEDGKRTWSVTRTQYDANGQITMRRALLTQLTALDVTADELDATKLDPLQSSGDEITRYVYDPAGHVTATAVAKGIGKGQEGTPDTVEWSVSANQYDYVGNLVATTRYATALTGAPSSEAAAATWMASVGASDDDRVTRYAYDALNRVQYTVAADGAVSKLGYDSHGNVCSSIAYATAYTTKGLLAADFAPTISTDDRVTTTVHDALGRPVYTVDAAGAVTEHQYDTLGRETATVQYAQALKKTLPAEAVEKDVTDVLVKVPEQDRTVHYAYDQAGRVRFTVDAGNYVSETRYDALGQVSETLQYSDPETISDFSLANLVSVMAAKEGSARTASFAYDAQGNLTTSTDGLGHAESYGYDALGRKTSFINKLGKEWNYQYNAMGQLLCEQAPEVAVYDTEGGMANVRVETHTGYDAFGNVATRTEAANTTSARTTTYGYDLMGRQVTTTIMAVPVYDSANDPLSITDMERHETAAVAAVTTVEYNALGDAVRNTDALGNVTGKEYDKRGQVINETDALQKVTHYERDVFGNVLTLTRYADKVEANAANRVITMQYDKRNQLVRTIEAPDLVFDVVDTDEAGKPKLGYATVHRVTDNTYDAFGQLTERAVLGMRDEADGSLKKVGTSTDTRYRYNQRGQVASQFDLANTAEHLAATMGSTNGVADIPGGYVTTLDYDAAGNVTTKREYASLVAVDWNGRSIDKNEADRVTVTHYDNDNRRDWETHSVQVDTFADGKMTTTATTAQTTYEYDAAGNVIATTDALGGVTRNFYDDMGRVRAVTLAGGKGLSADDDSTRGDALAISLTEFRRDAYGNVVQQIERATATTTPVDKKTNQVVFEAVADSSDDRRTRFWYDLNGRVIQTQNAQNELSYTSYDLLGRVAKVWQRHTMANITSSSRDEVLTQYQVMKYDAVGRLAEIDSPANLVLDADGRAQDGVTFKSQTREYNAFGEVTAQRVNGVEFEHSFYDNSGRVWKTNSGDGVEKVMFYNLAGKTAAILRSSTVDAFAATSDAAAAHAQASGADMVLTESRYDMLGNAIEQIGEARSITPSTASSLVHLGMSTVSTTSAAWDFDDDGKGWAWREPNTVAFSMAPLDTLGAGQLRVDVNYHSNARSGGGTRFEATDVTHSEYVDASAIDVKDGQWNLSLNFYGSGIDSLTSVSVYKKDITGNWQLMTNNQAPVTQPAAGKDLFVVPAPIDAQAPAVLQVRPAGSNDAYSTVAGVNFGDQLAYDVSALTDGAYQFRVLYQDGAYETSQTEHLSGTLTLTAGSDGIRTISHTDQVKPAVTVRADTYIRTDRWGNTVEITDARNPKWSLIYTYNQVNERRTEQSYQNGSATSALTSNTYYDALGRTTGTRDGLGHLTRQLYDGNGRLGEEVRADGGVTDSSYNVFGERTSQSVLVQVEQSTPQIPTLPSVPENVYQVTSYHYDHLGRVDVVSQAATTVYFTTLNEDETVVKEDHYVDQRSSTQTFTYDELGRRIDVQDGMGNVTRTSYDMQGDVVGTRDGAGVVMRYAFDDFHHMISQTDGELRNMTWHFDIAHGVMDAHTDMGGTNVTYVHDGMNRLTHQSSKDGNFGHQDVAMEYEGGLLTRIVDLGTNTTTTYAYDMAGQRVREQVRVAKAGYGDLVLQDNHTRYDQLGRISTVQDERYNLSIEYDAAGNREHVDTKYINDLGQSVHVDSHNTFDAVNRALIVDGELANGEVVRGSHGHKLTYDLAGNRKTDDYVRIDSGNFAHETSEIYTYDEAGRLETVIRDQVLVDSRHYDLAGRLVHSGGASESKLMRYDGAGRGTRVKTFGENGSAQDDLYYESSNEQDGIGYDKAGNLKGYKLVPPGADTTKQSTYIYSYKLGDSYKEGRVEARRDGKVEGSSTEEYDVNGNLTEVGQTSVSSPGERHVWSGLDGIGLLTTTSTHDETHNLVVNGAVLGTSGNRQRGTFADPYQGIAEVSSSGLQGQVYRVESDGQTLQTVAQAVWGDSNLWYLIADANGIDPSSTLEIGTTLVLPQRLSMVANTSDTFKPYNPADFVGDTSVTLAARPLHEKCGGGGPAIAMMVAFYVMVLAQQYQWGALLYDWAAGSTGAAAAGVTGVANAAVAAAAGEVASQAVLNASGDMHGFKWGQVAVAAVGSGLSAYMGQSNMFSDWGSPTAAALARATVADALTQGVAIAVHAQDHFEWSGVRGALAGAIASEAMGQATAGMKDPFSKGFLGTLARDMGRNAELHRQLVGVGDVSDAFGNALGDSLTESMSGSKGPELTDAQKEAERRGFGPMTDEAARAKLSNSSVRYRAVPDASTQVDGGPSSIAPLVDPGDDQYPEGAQYRFIRGGPAADEVGKSSVPSQNDLQDAADTLNRRVKIFANAAEYARARGDQKSADAYQKEVINNYYAAIAYESAISNMRAEGGDGISIDRNSNGSNSFGPDWSYMGQNASGIAFTDLRSQAYTVFQFAYHVPVSPGVAAGHNFTWSTEDPKVAIAPDIAIGSIVDIGLSVGVYGDGKYNGPTQWNFGLFKLIGGSIQLSNSLAYKERPWYSPGRYINGVNLGVGVGIAAPINVTIDPTYTSP